MNAWAPLKRGGCKLSLSHLHLLSPRTGLRRLPRACWSIGWWISHCSGTHGSLSTCLTYGKNKSQAREQGTQPPSMNSHCSFSAAEFEFPREQRKLRCRYLTECCDVNR